MDAREFKIGIKTLKDSLQSLGIDRSEYRKILVEFKMTDGDNPTLIIPRIVHTPAADTRSEITIDFEPLEFFRYREDKDHQPDWGGSHLWKIVKEVERVIDKAGEEFFEWECRLVYDGVLLRIDTFETNKAGSSIEFFLKNERSHS